MAWDLSRRDWEERIRQGLPLVPQLPLIESEAERAVSIFDRLRLPDVPGMPRLKDAAGDWFRDIIAAMFGAWDPATLERHIRKLFLLAPKKSSKTSYGAALMLTALLMNRRPGAEFLLIAPTKLIAQLAFDQAIGMIRADRVLRKQMHIQDHIKQITDQRLIEIHPGEKAPINAQLKIKAFDASVLTGVKPVAALIDELHEIAKDPAAERIIGQLRGGILPNPEGFLAFITTQSDEPPVGAFREELIAARKVRDGEISGSTLAVLYEFPEEMTKWRGAPEMAPWRDPATWWMVTPNRGRSVSIERLVEDFDEAQGKGEKEIRRWASQHLNIEIGLALRSDAWVGANYWERQADATITFETLLKRCEVVVCGIDGGGLDDLLGFAVMGREIGTGRWLHWARAWAQRDVRERRKDIVSTLDDFAAQGDLVFVDQVGDDTLQLVELIETIDQSGKAPEEHWIGVDPHGAKDIVEEIGRREINTADRKTVIGISQSWQLAGPIMTAERALKGGKLVHAGQPLMAWAVGNAKVEPRGNAVTITKQAAGKAKIDPLMAMLDAVAIIANNPEAGGSVYSADRGLLIVDLV